MHLLTALWVGILSLASMLAAPTRGVVRVSQLPRVFVAPSYDDQKPDKVAATFRGVEAKLRGALAKKAPMVLDAKKSYVGQATWSGGVHDALEVRFACAAYYDDAAKTADWSSTIVPRGVKDGGDCFIDVSCSVDGNAPCTVYVHGDA